ncbi:hypothetical protein F0562_004908 [Nyssa sinensis]|uniref:Titin-like n=1 Tax=Nyssa sinensis TaxID=561372 RepID=A0A5J5AJ35_9ASTE|nr:hypothetical protein F0562_004908 [Nyssa sinensis]
MNEVEPQSNEPSETTKYLEKSENMQAATNIEFENANAVIKGNVGKIEGENFLGSLSAAKVACEETSRARHDYKATETPNQVEKEVPNNEILREDEKNEREEMPNDSTKDVCISTEAASPENQNKEEGIEKSEGAKEKPGNPLVTALTDETTMENAGLDVGGKLEENSSITFQERSKETIESIENMKDETSIEDEIQEDSNLESSFARKIEDRCFLKVDKPEVIKEVSKIASEDIFKEGQIKVQNQNEALENIATASSRPSMTGKEDANPKPKVDGSFMKQKENLHREGEELAPTEASTRECSGGEGVTVVEGEDNIEAEEHGKKGTSKHEEHLQQSFLKKNEPGKENLESPSNLAYEEIKTTASNEHAETLTHIEEQRSIESLAEILEETRMDKTINADNIKKKEIQEAKQQTISTIDLNEKTISAEVEIPNKHANDLYVSDPLVEETVQVGGEKQGEVSRSDLEEQVHEVNAVPAEEEKHDNEAYEASKSTESTILEHKSTEEAPDAETTPEASEMVKDAEDNIKEEIQQKEEVSDTELQRSTVKSDANEKSMIEEDFHVNDSNTICTEEAHQLSCQQTESKKYNSEEEASELNGGDQSCRTDNETENIDDQIINEEVYEGPKITGTDKGTKKQIKNTEHTVIGHSTESKGEKTTKCSQEYETEAEKYKSEIEEELETTGACDGIRKQIIAGENRIQDESMVSIEEETITESYKEDEMMAKMPKKEMLEIQTADKDADMGVHIKEEDGTEKDNFTEFAGEETKEERSYLEKKETDTEASEGLEIAGASTATKRQNIEESVIRDLPSLTVGKETVEESLSEEERDVIKPDEEVKKLYIECIEQNLEATHPTEKPKSEAIKDEAEPNENCYVPSSTRTSQEEGVPNESNGDLVGNSSSLPKVSAKEIKGEILEKKESTEEISLKEAEAEDKMQVDSSDPTTEEKGLVTIEASETRSDGADIIAKPAEASKVGENKDMENPTAGKHGIDEAGEKIELEVKNGTHYTLPKSEDEREVATVEISLDEILDQSFEASSMLSLKEHDLVTTDMSETIDKTPDKDEATYAKAETTLVLATKEKKLMQNKKAINKRDEADMESLDIGKESANEVVHDKEQDSEASETRSIFTSTKENLESVEPSEELKYDSESLPKDQSNSAFPQANKTKIEEKSNNVEDQNTDSTGEQDTGEDFQEGNKKMNKEMETNLEAKDHINEPKDANETTKNVILTEEVPAGVERADRTENIKEQIIEEEGHKKELHEINMADETVNKVKDQDLEPIESPEAVDSNEDTETVRLKVAEDLNWEVEASPLTKASEEEMETACEKPVDVTSSVSEGSEEENLEVADACDEKTDTLPTVVMPDRSLGKIQLDNKSLKAFDTSSDSKNPETIRTTETSPQGEEVDSLKLEETFGLVSQLPTIEHENSEKKSEKSKNSDVDEDEDEDEDGIEVKEIKTSDLVSETKDQSVEEILQNGTSLIVGTTDTDGIEEEIKQVPEPQLQGVVEAVSDADITPDQTLPANEQVPVGVERTDEIENIKEQIIDEESRNKELHVISIADEIVNEVKDPDLECIESLKATNSNEDTETTRLKVAEDLKWEAEASPLTRASEEEMKKSSKKPVDVTNSISEEENMEVAGDCNEKTDTAPTVVMEDISLREVQHDDKSLKAFDTSSDTKSPEITKTTETSPRGEEVDSVKLEETSGMVSQLPTIEHENADKKSEKLKKSDADTDEIEVDVEESKMSDVVSETKDQSVEEILESGTSLIVGTTDTVEIKEVPQRISEPQHQGVEATTDGEMAQNHTLAPIEQVLAGIERADETENIKQQIVDTESRNKKLHVISKSNETVKEVKDPELEHIESLEATDSNEDIKTTRLKVAEDLNWAAEASPSTKASEEEMKKASKKLVDVTNSISDVLEEEDIEVAGDCNEKTDTAPTMVMEDISSWEVQQDDKSLNAFDTSSDTKSPETTKTTKTSLWSEEVDSAKLEETSGMVSQLPTIEHENADKKSENFKKSDVDADAHEIKVDVEETKTSDVVSETKDQCVEEILESGTSLIVGTTDTVEIKQEIKEVPQTIFEPQHQGVEATTDREIAHNETLTPIEQVLAGIERADETANIKQQIIDTESCNKELHVISKANETVNEVKDTELERIESLKATDSNEEAKTTRLKVAEDLIWEAEAFPLTKASEEEMKKASEKPVDVTNSISDVSEEENMEVAGDCNEKTDTAPKMVMEDISSREVQQDDKSLKDFDTSSDTRSPETTKTIETSLWSEEVDSVKLEETSGMMSQLPTIEHENADKKSENFNKSDADADADEIEVEETKTSDMVIETKDQSVEEILESETSLIVGTTDTSEIKEEIKEVPQRISEPQHQGVEATTDGEITQNQTLVAIEQVLAGIERADETENIKQQIIDAESRNKELHVISKANETVNEVKEPELEHIESLEAIDSNEDMETTRLKVAEDLNWEAEASPLTKASEEEMKKANKKPVDVTNSISDVSEEENMELAGDCNEKTDTAPTMVMEDISSPEVQQDDKSLKDFDTSSDTKSPETTKTTETSLWSEEVDSVKLEETSGMMSQLPTIEHENADKKSENFNKSDADADADEIEVEETKTSDMVIETKDQSVEEILESGTSLIVGTIDTSEIKEEIKEVPETIYEPQHQGVEATTDGEITQNQTLVAIEQVLAGIERADETENIKQQIIDTESRNKELHVISKANETVNEVKEPELERIDSLEEDTETRRLKVAEDLNWEAKASPLTKALEEEMKKSSEKPVDVTNSISDISKEENMEVANSKTDISKEENMEVAGDCNEKTGPAPTMVIEDISSGEVLQDDKSSKAFDTISDNNSPETTKIIETSPWGEEVDNVKLEETSGMVSQLQTIEHEHADKKSEILKKSDADADAIEVEETKTSDMVTETKDQSVEEILESGTSLTVGTTDTDEIKEEIKEVPETIYEPQHQGVEAVSDGEITPDQTLPAIEQEPARVEKDDETENIKEQIIEEESRNKEFHVISITDETINEVKDPNLEPIKSLEATDSNKDTKTTRLKVAKDLKWEVEASPFHKASEEEMKKSSKNPVDVTSSVSEEENIGVANGCSEEDTAPTVVMEDISSRKVHQDDKSVKAFDTSSDTKSPETTETSPCGEEAACVKLEETSGMVSQLPTIEHENADKKSEIFERPDADADEDEIEVEETKISDMVSETKDQSVEEILEHGTSLTVGTTDTDEIKEEIKEVPETISEPQQQGLEAVTDGEITPDQTLLSIEQVPAGVARDDKTEDFKEQIIDKESHNKELHVISIVDETVNEVKDPHVAPIESLEATGSDEDTKKMRLEVAEDLNWEAEASPMTKASEEEMKKASEKPADVTSSVSEVSEEENMEVAGDCNEKTDTAPTMVIEDKSLREVLQDESLKAFDTSSDTKSLETTETSPQRDEVDSVKLEETSSMVSQLTTIEHKKEDKKSEKLKKSEADEDEDENEVEETKTSDAVSGFKDQSVEEILESGTSLTVGTTDTDGIEEEIKEIPATVTEPKHQGVEAVADGEITLDQTLTAEKLEEQFQAPSSALLFNKQYHETLTTIEQNKDEGTKKNETELDSMKLEETSGMVSHIPTTEQNNADDMSVTVEKLDADEVEVEGSKTFDAVCESKDQGVEDINETNVQKTDEDKVEKEIKGTPETIFEFRHQDVEAVMDSGISLDQTLPVGKSEQQREVQTSALLSKEQDHETMATIDTIEDEGTDKDETEVDSMNFEKNSGIVSELPTIEQANADKVSVIVEHEVGVEEIKTSDAVCESKELAAEDIHETEISLTVGKIETDKMDEEIKEVLEAISEPKYQSVEVVTDGEITLDQTLPAGNLEEQLQVPSFALLSREQNHETTTTTEKIGDENTNNKETEQISGMESQMPAVERANAHDMSVTVEMLDEDGVEVEEMKTFDAVCESKDQGVVDFHESAANPTVGKTNADKIVEEIKETPEPILAPRYQDVEAVTDGEITLDQALPAGKSEQQLEVSTSALLSKEQDRETMSIVKKTEDESTNNDETKVYSMKLEETSGVASQLPTMEQDNADNASVSVENEVGDEEIKASDAVCNSKDLIIEEIHETGTSLTVAKSNTDKTEDVIKEVLEAISEPKYQTVEAVTDGEITLDQTLPAGKLEEQLQVPSSALLSREQGHETTTITEKLKDDSAKRDETEVDSMKLEETSGTVSQLPTNERENADDVSATVTDEVEGHKTSDTLHESKVQGVEDIYETGTSPAMVKVDTDKMEEEIRGVPETISKRRNQGAEAIADGKITSSQSIPAGILEQQLQVPSSSLLSREQDHETMISTEKIEDEITEVDSLNFEETSGMVSQLSTTEQENADGTSLTVEKLVDADEVEETKTSDTVCELKDQDAKEIHETGTGATEGKTDANKMEEEIIKINETISEPRYQGVEADTSGEITPDQTQPARVFEEQLQVPSNALLSKEQDHETMTTIEKIEDESTKKDDTRGNENLFGTSTREESCLRKEEPRGLQVSKMELKLIEDIQGDSPNEASKEESSAIEEDSATEPQEYVSEIKYADSRSECEKSPIQCSLLGTSIDEDVLDSGNSIEKVDNLFSPHSTVQEILPGEVGEKTGNILESASEVHIPEVIDKAEEKKIKEEQIEAAITELRAKENQSEGISEANETIKNEISSEKITEEKDAAKESHLVSGETIAKSNQEDELSAEEYPRDKLNETIKITKDIIPNEELLEEIEKAGAHKNIGETTTGNDRAVTDTSRVSFGGGTIIGNLLEEETDGKNVEKEPFEIDLENWVDVAHCGETATKAVALSEEVRSSEVVFVNHKENRKDVNDKETVIRKDEEVQELNVPPVLDAVVEKAPDKNVGEKIEEVSEPTLKEPIQEIFEKYEEIKEIASVNSDNSESLIDDEKLKQTSPKSEGEVSDVIQSLNLKEQEVCANEPSTSSLTETSQKEVADKESEKKVHEKLHDFMFDKQKMDEVSGSGGKSIECEEHRKDEDPVDESTNKEDTHMNEDFDDSFATSTTEETCLQKEEPRELEVSKMELRLIEDMQEDSPNEASKDENTDLEEVSAIEPQEYVSEIQYADSPSECEKRPIHCSLQVTSKDEDVLDSGNSIKEVDDLLSPPHSTVNESLPGEVGEKCEEASNLKFEKTAEVLKSASDVQCPEVLNKPDEIKIKEEHHEAAITELKDKENLSDRIFEANETKKKEILSEKILEETDVAKDSNLMSPDEETITKGNREDESRAEEYPREDINETIEITKNNEKLFKEMENAGEYKNIEEKTMGNDRTVKDTSQILDGNGTIIENLLGKENEGKNASDLENRGDEANCGETATEAMALSEEASSSEAIFVKHEENRKGDNDMETVIRKDEEVQELNVPPVTKTVVEGAPEKNVYEKLEEVSEPTPKEPIHEIIKRYEDDKEIASAVRNNSESLMDDEKLKQTYPKSACKEPVEHPTIEKIENESTKKDDTQVNENLFATSTTEHTCLQKEESRELGVYKMELKLTEDIQEDSPTEASRVESTALEEFLATEPQEYVSEMKYADSPSECEKRPIHCSLQLTSNNDDVLDSGNSIKEVNDLPGPHSTVKESLPGEVGEKCNEASNLEFEQTAQVPESASDVHSTEVLNKPDEIKIREEQLEPAVTELRAKENQSEGISESNETSKNEISSEKIVEEKDVSKDPVSPDEETIKKSNQEDELRAEEDQREKRNETNEITKNNEEFFEEIEKVGAYKNIEKTTTGDDRAVKDTSQVLVGNETIIENLLEEAKDGKNVEKAPFELDLENQGDKVNCGETATEAMALSEEVSSSEVVFVKHEENRKGADDKETVIRKDSVVEEAPEKIVGEKIEEGFEPTPIEPIYDIIETYEENKEIASANSADSECLVDDKKHNQTSPKSAREGSDVIQGLNLKEQEACASEPSTSSLTETSQKEVADKESKNKVHEKQHENRVHEIIKNEISSEKILEETDVAEDSNLMSPDEEKITKGNQEDESRAEEYPREKIKETIEITKNNEKLFREMEKDGEYKNIEETTMGDDRAVENTSQVLDGNGTIIENLLEKENEGKNASDLEYQGDEANCGETATEAMALSEEVSSSEVVFVKHEENRKCDNDMETGIRKDEEVQELNVPPGTNAVVEGAPEKNVGEKIEEVSEPTPKEPIHEIIKRYEDDKEIASAVRNNSESLVDDEKLKQTSPKSACKQPVEHPTIEMIEIESTKKDDTQVNENLFASITTEDTCLQKEESRELGMYKMELKLTEDIQEDSPTEASRVESTALEEVSATEPQEYVSEMKYADSPSECEKRPIHCSLQLTSKDEDVLDSGNSIKEVNDLPSPHSTVKESLPGEVGEKCDEASNLEFEKTAEVPESASDVHSTEVLNKPDEIKIREEQHEAAVTELRATENQSEGVSESNETSKNEISNEKIVEEKDVSKDSVSPDEETIKKSNHDDELRAEEYQRGKINEANEITKNNEEFFEEIEKVGAYKSIEKTTIGDDRAVKDTSQVLVGDETIIENLLEEAEDGKNVKKAPFELDLENQGDKVNCAETATEAMALREEVSSSEVVFVKHEENRKGADDKETVIRKDSVVEEAPDKIVGEKIEEVFKRTPTEPISDIIETHEENKEIASANSADSECLIDDEKHKQTSPKSACEVSDIIQGLNLKEQEACANEPSTSSLTETSQKEEADKESKNKVHENRVLEIIKNEISSEKILEETDVAEDSNLVSPDEETITKGNQEDELSAEEYPREKINETIEITKNNEKLFKEMEKDEEYKNIEETTMGDDRAVKDTSQVLDGNGIIIENLLEKENEGKNASDLENRGDEANCGETATEAMALSEEVSSSEVVFVKHEKNRKVDNDMETGIRKDEEVQEVNVPPVTNAVVEGKNVGEKIEEVSEPTPREPIHEIIKRYEDNKEIASAVRNNSESLMDDEKLMQTSPISACKGSDVIQGLNQKEQEVSETEHDISSILQEPVELPTIKKIEDENTKKDDTQVNENLFATSKTEDTCLQKEEPRELGVYKMELKLTKDIQEDSPNEASREESTALEEFSAIKPQEYVSEMKYADSPSECEKRPIHCSLQLTSKHDDVLDSGNSIKEVNDLPSPHSTVEESLPGEAGEKCDEASNLEFEKTAEVPESASDVHSTEVLDKPDEIKIREEQLEPAVTELRAKENQSEGISESNETSKNEISSEKIVEGKDVSKDPVSPDEETIKKSIREDELRAEEYQRKKINEINEITKNNEELFEEIENVGAYRNIEKTTTGNDRAVKDTSQVLVGDESIIENLLEEAEDGKKVKKAPFELDLENQGDKVNCGETATEAMALREEVSSSEVVFVKHEENRKGADDKETVIRKDSVVEEAPDKIVGEKIEEVFEPTPIEPIYDIIETHEENKEIASANSTDSECLVDDEKHKQTSPKSACEGSDVIQGLNLKEQEACANEPSTSSLTETSQKVAADKESKNKVHEKQHDFIFNKQKMHEVSTSEGRKTIKCLGEHRKDAEPVEISTRGNEKQLHDAEIHTLINANDERETQVQNKENVSADIKDSGMWLSQKDDLVDPAKGNEIIRDVQELEKTTFAITNEQIPREAGPNKSTEAMISTGSKDIPLVQQDQTAKTFQNTKVEDLKAGNASWDEPEMKGIESGEEKRMGYECEETTENPTSIEAAKISLSDPLGSSKETSQVTKHLTEERELIVNKEDLLTEKVETTQVEEEKTDEEKDEGEEHKRTGLDSDAPVIVEASRDMDVKIAHKRSHNILSGVGSKVKHSIAKMKKVIACNSSQFLSHPEPPSPK